MLPPLPDPHTHAEQVASITVHHKLCCSTVARTLMFILGASLQDLQATHLLGQLDTRVVMHVFQKKDPTRKTFKALSEIGAAFWEDLCSRIGLDREH